MIGGNLGKAKWDERFLGLWEEGRWEQATVSPALDKGRGFLCSRYTGFSMGTVQGCERTARREDRDWAGFLDAPG